MTKVLYTLNASCRHPTQHFAISQSKVPHFDLMSSLTTGHYTSPQNRFLYSCAPDQNTETAPSFNQTLQVMIPAAAWPGFISIGTEIFNLFCSYRSPFRENPEFIGSICLNAPTLVTPLSLNKRKSTLEHE